ncbi:MAG TPA: alkaline phosphatase family protein [Candidatus Binatia bacterium]|nr:alkaline phosphatase family protein [Candidatus Binatia bacterium]
MRSWLRRVVTSLILLAALRAGADAAPPSHVFIVLIDGLDATRLTEQLTPTLWGLAHGASGHATFYPDGRSVIPSVTNTNHAAVMTAAYAEAHGVVGNAFWERKPGRAPTGSESARFLQVETLFTVIEHERPELRTAGLFGKSRLAGLFRKARHQLPPDHLWGDVITETESFDARAGFASDQRTMDEVLRTLTLEAPNFMFAALPDVDRTSHMFGPDSHEARRALLEADRQVSRLVEVLRRRGLWPRTVLMVTADHGMSSVAPNVGAGRPYPLVLFGRELARAGFNDVVPVANGSVETLALPGHAPVSLGDRDAQRLADIRKLALAQPEVAEAWYRLPNASDGGDEFTLSHAHPDWHINHPRLGELILVAKPNHHFGDPFTPHLGGLEGNHGGPNEAHIPIIIAGGDSRIRSQVVGPNGSTPSAANPDLGATAAWLLGVRMPRLTNGKPVPSESAGRVLREAFE